MEYKIGKYIKKLYTSRDKESQKVYLKKIQYYTNKNGQIGGTNADLDTNIAVYINDIIQNNYRLQTDLDIIKNITYDLGQCQDDFFGNFADTDTITYKNGQRFNCFIRPFGMSEAKENIYFFKKSFSLDFTDIYMQQGLTKQNLTISTNFIYFILNHTVNVFIENMMRVKKFGDKTQHLLDNVFLLYKGGNTTRIIFNCFIKSANKMFENSKKSIGIDKSIKNLNDLIQNYNVGDWDYLIKINFDKLKENGYTDDELNILIKLLLQSLYYSSTYIKNKLSLLLKSKINIDVTAQAIQTLMNSEDITKRIEKFINVYNNDPSITDIRKIDSLFINNIFTFDKVIEKNNVKNMEIDDYDILYKNSFIFKTTGNVKEYKGTDYTVDEYVEVNTPFIDTQIQNYIPESLKKDMVYIAYLSDVGFCRRYAISSFNLLRVKISNLIQFDVKYKEMDPLQKKKMYVNFELVDVSVSNIYDCKDIFNYHYYYQNYRPMVNYNINNPLFKEEKIIIPIPSPQLMFADICHMLFTENLFIWEDRKYSKRIKRLFFLSLPCMYYDKLKTNDMIIIYEVVHQLFSGLTTHQSIDLRLAMMNGHYDIVESPYSNNINIKINVQTMQKFKDLKISHKIIKIKETSPYSKCKYIEFLIGNYIRMLITSNYIINNKVENSNQELVKYELLIHRILEMPKIYEYIKPGISFGFTKPLKTVYMETRGTTHTLTNSDLLPLGPLNQLVPANPAIVNKFMDDLKTYENTIIDNCKYTLEILKGFQEANIQNVPINYEDVSLF